MIKPVGDKWRLYSEHVDPKTGERRNLGTFDSEDAAKHHEQLIQAFKRGWHPTASVVRGKPVARQQ